MAKTQNPEKLTAVAVLEALCGDRCALGAPAHACLYEVSNSTGFAANRRADALVVSCWPSRGVWFGGVEVKVDRVDWLRELKDPAKSAAIQRWCSYWWVAAPKGVVHPGEVPETWGWYEVSTVGAAGEKSRVKLMKEAPKLEAEPPTATFVASLLRNAGEAAASVTQRAVDKAMRTHAGVEQVEAARRELYEAKQARTRAEQELRFATRERDELRAVIETFERGVGDGFFVNRHASAAERAGRLYAAALALQHTDLDRVANQLGAVVEALRAVNAPKIVP